MKPCSWQAEELKAAALKAKEESPQQDGTSSCPVLLVRPVVT